jgi:hypothetical protein
MLKAEQKIPLIEDVRLAQDTLLGESHKCNKHIFSPSPFSLPLSPTFLEIKCIEIT